MKRIAVGMAVTVLCAISLFIVPTTKSYAQSTFIIQCLGSINSTFNPGITTSPRTTTLTVSVSESTCALPLGANLTGTLYNSGAAPISCVDLFQVVPPPGTYNWSNGQASTVKWDSLTVVNGDVTSVATSLGTVISGYDAGAQVKVVDTYLNSSLLACNSPQGLTSLNGTEVLLFTPPL